MKSIGLNKEAGRAAALADSQMMLGTVFETKGQLGDANDLYSQSLDQMQESGDLKGISNAHLCLGNVARAKGDLKNAEDRYWRCLSAGGSAKNKEFVVSPLPGRGACGRLRNARRHSML